MIRKVNIEFDSNPAPHHQNLFSLSKKYIQGKIILDIGCWTGQYSKLASQFAKQVYGIDPNQEAIKYAQGNVPKGRFIVGSAVNLPYKSHMFDVVIMSEVLEHVPKNTELNVFKEIKRVLKKGGTLILSTPNKNIVSILLDPAFFILNHRHYSQNDIQSYLKALSFEVDTIYSSKGLTNLMVSNIELIFKYLFHKKPHLPTIVQKVMLKEMESNGFASVYAIAKAK